MDSPNKLIEIKSLVLNLQSMLSQIGVVGTQNIVLAYNSTLLVQQLMEAIDKYELELKGENKDKQKEE